MIKLYIDIDHKDKSEIYGTIYNKPRKNQQEIYLRYSAIRLSDTVFKLTISKPLLKEFYSVNLDETIDCSMTAKDILFYVDQRIELLMKSL